MTQPISVAYMQEIQPYPEFVLRGQEPTVDRFKMQLDSVAVHLRNSYQVAAANSKESYNREVQRLREELREANEYNLVLNESLQLAAEDYEQIRRKNEILESKCERYHNDLVTNYKYLHVKEMHCEEMHCEENIATLMSKKQMLTLCI